MLSVLGISTSINVRKVLWLCEELELSYAHEEWGSGAHPTHDPEFLALNPNGLVPVIRDGDVVLSQSNTICRYLASKHGRSDLLPDRPADRACVEQWMDWQATDLNMSWRYAFMHLVRKNPEYTDPTASRASAANWNSYMEILDGQLAKTRAYVAGGTFTLADIVIGVSVNRWYMTPIDRPELRGVADYYERLKERPGFILHGANGMP